MSKWDELKGTKSKYRDVKPLKKYKKLLPVDLNNEDIIALSGSAGKLSDNLEKLETELKEETSEKRTVIKEKKDKLKKMMREMATSTREQEIPVADIPVYDQNMVEIVRQDDFVIIDVRAMVAAERQQDLGVKDAPKGAKN